jgi:hypothetical protein
MALNLVAALIYLWITRYHPGRPDVFRSVNVGVAVVVWVLADVANTNQLGRDADRVAARLDLGHRLVPELVRKNLALGAVLAPLAVGVSALARTFSLPDQAFGQAVLADLGAVLLWLGAGSVVSVLLPYRPLTLQERRARPSSWARWLCCQAAPYGVAVVVMPVLHLPYVFVARLTEPGGLLPPGLSSPAGYLAAGFLFWATGLAAAARLARTRRFRLPHGLRRAD